MLVCFSPSISLALSVNDGIVSTASPTLNVRQTPSATGTVLASVPPNTIGVILGGPENADGFTWYQIIWSYQSTAITGWSVQNYLATTPPSSTVYADYYPSPGWHHLPWANMTTNYNSSTKRNGTSGIQATASAAYARLYMRTTIGFSTLGKQTLRISLMNPISGNGQRLYVALYNTSGIPFHYVSAFNYVSGGSLATNTWYDLAIPISDLWATNQTVGGVVIETDIASTFYVDDVYFNTNLESTYWSPPPTVSSVSVSCSPTSINVSSTSQCSATVNGTGNPSQIVSWGASAGSINSSGLFTAPSSVPSPAGVSIVATSNQDPSKSGSVTVTITNPQLSQASSDVFTEALGTGWNIGGWSQVTTDPTSDTSYQGSYGMQVQIATPSWGRVQLKTNSGYKFNTAGKTHLAFAINIGKYEVESLHVALLNQGGTAISSYVDITSLIDPYQWKVVYIPLTSLGVNSATDIYGVEIQSVAPATIFIDSIKFKGDCNGL